MKMLKTQKAIEARNYWRPERLRRLPACLVLCCLSSCSSDQRSGISEQATHEPKTLVKALPTPAPTPVTQYTATIRVEGYADPHGADLLMDKTLPDGTKVRPQPAPPPQAKVNGQVVNLPYVSTRMVKVGDDVSVDVEEVWSTIGGHAKALIYLNWGKGDMNVHVMESQDAPNSHFNMTYRVPPQGATAACNDGNFSFAEKPQGDCSHHNGVFQWYAGYLVDTDHSPD
jgi:hypothetical protein